MPMILAKCVTRGRGAWKLDWGADGGGKSESKAASLDALGMQSVRAANDYDVATNPYKGTYAGGGAYGGEEYGVSNDEKGGISAAEFKKLYGGIIDEKARQLGVDSNILGGLILTEASGSGFKGGNLKVRLEPSYFNYFTGDKYSDLFMEDEDGIQKYRESVDQPWKPIHESQESERAAFEVVKRLDPAAAYKSISMGLGQIMGENYEAAGYKSAEEMYEDFSKGHWQQIEGTGRFIRNTGVIHQAMQRGNLRKVAEHYNGPRNVDEYSGKIQRNMDLYKNLP